MAVTFVSAAAGGDDLAYPSFQEGDVAFAFVRSSSGNVYTLPNDGWHFLGGSSFARVAWRALHTGDTSTGSWALGGATITDVGLVIYRGANTSWPADWAGAFHGTSTGFSNSINFPAANPEYSGGLNLNMAMCYGATNAQSMALTGWTNRTSGLSGTHFAALDSGSAAQTGTFSGTAAYSSMAVSIIPASTFPVLATGSVMNGSEASNTTTWNLEYPWVVEAGDLMIAMLAIDGTGTSTTWPAGWVVGAAASGANTLVFAKKKADGTESAGTFDVTTPSEQGAWRMYRIPAAEWEGTLGTTFDNTANSGSVCIATATGVNANPNPPSLNPNNWASGDTLWIAVASSDTSRTYSAYPTTPGTFIGTGYTASGGTGGATIAWCHYDSNATSVDPGTFTHSSSDDWVAGTIAVRPNLTTVSGNLNANAIIKRTQSNRIDVESASDQQWIGAPITGYTNSMTIGIATGDAPTGFGSNSTSLDSPGTLSDRLAYVPLIGTYLSGVEYTIRFWIKQSSGSGQVAWTVGSKVTNTDRKASGAQTITGSWVQKTVVWTPNGDRNDAVLAVYTWGTVTTTILVDGVQVDLFTIDAVLAEASGNTVSGSFSANAVVKKTMSGSGSADAVIRKPDRPGSITSEAVLRKGRTGTLTADAVIKKTLTPTATANAILKKTIAPTALTANAIVRKERTGSLTADAVIKKTIASTLTANAVIKRGQAGSFSAAAVIKRLNQPGSATADAVLRKERTGSLTAEAVVKKTQSGSVSANAVVKKAQSGSFTANAVVLRYQSGSLTANAIVKKTATGSATANAVVKRGQSGSFAADAVIRRLGQPGTATANAVLRKERAGSLTADSIIRRAQTGSISADAIVKKTITVVGVPGADEEPTRYGTLDAWFTAGMQVVEGSKTADAIIKRGQAGSFAADAVLRRERTGSLTADAVIKRGQTGSASANAVVRRTQELSFSAAAVIKRGQVGSAGVDAVIRRMQAGAASADAVIRRARAGSLTADSILRKIQTASATADAIKLRTLFAYENHYTHNDSHFEIYDSRQAAQTFQSAAPIYVTHVDLGLHVQGTPPNVLTVGIYATSGGDPTGSALATGSVAVAGVGTEEGLISRVQITPGLHLEAGVLYAIVLFTTGGDTNNDWHWNFDSTSADYANGQKLTYLAAVWTAQPTQDFLFGLLGPGWFYADAVLVRTTSSSASADAVIKRLGQPGSGTADAVIRKPDRPGSGTVDAIIRRERTGSITANAIVLRAISGSITADAVVKRGQAGSLSGDAVVRRTALGVSPLDAVLRRGSTASLTTDAIVRRERTSAISSDAVLLRGRTGSLTADAVIARGRASSIAADAVIRRTQLGSFSAAAVIKRPDQLGSATANAVIKREQASSLTANAVLLRSGVGSLSADAVLFRQWSGSLTGDAVVRRTTEGGSAADAVLLASRVAILTTDAILLRGQSGSFSINAVLNSVSKCIWTTPGNTIQIDPDAILHFLMPQAAAGDMHFEIQIDTVATFDGIYLRIIKSHSDLAGWEFWDGGAWQPIPQSGVPNTYCGNEARYAIQTPLTNETWYRRVRAGVI